MMYYMQIGFLFLFFIENRSACSRQTMRGARLGARLAVKLLAISAANFVGRLAAAAPTADSTTDATFEAAGAASDAGFACGESESAADDAEQKRLRRKGWPCSEEQARWMKLCRSRFDANPQVPAESGDTFLSWAVHPPNPIVGSAVTKVLPQPCKFQRHPWAAWCPEQLFPRWVQAPCCPTCGLDSYINVAAASWRRTGPRRVLGGPTGVFYLDCKQYYCGSGKEGCGSFYPTHPNSVKKVHDHASRINHMPVACGAHVRFACLLHSCHRLSCLSIRSSLAHAVQWIHTQQL